MDFSGTKKTPLFKKHVEMGAKMVDFGGWALPLSYSGILEEHTAVRTGAGVFDVSHMGEILVKGPDAEAFVSHLMTNDISGMETGQAIYSPMCYEHGGTVDDVIIHKTKDGYYIVINAANEDKDFLWITDNAVMDVDITDLCELTAQIALQGPKAAGIMQGICPDAVSLARYRFGDFDLCGHNVMIARTGYTGEDGFELYMKPEAAVPIFELLLERGAVPCGLGARDTLRFECAMPLYGNEMDENISPLEAGLGVFVKLDKKDGFIGHDALAAQKQAGHARRIGLKMLERGIARSHYPVFDGNGKQIGEVTSGSYSPTLNGNYAMARVNGGPPVGGELYVDVRGKRLKAERVKLPFYKK